MVMMASLSGAPVFCACALTRKHPGIERRRSTTVGPLSATTATVLADAGPSRASTT